MRNQKQRFLQMLKAKYPNADIQYRIKEEVIFKNGKKVDCSYQYVFSDKKTQMTLGKFNSDIKFIEDYVF